MTKNILLFWHYNDWGQYGRTYERIAYHLSQLPEVNKIVCIFPPVSKNKEDYAFPIYFSKNSSSLYILEQSCHILPSNGHFWKMRQWANQNLPDLVLKLFLKFLGFNHKNTILWLFPPHPYLEKLIRIIPHIFSITHVVDDFSKLGNDFWLYDYAISQYPRLGEISNFLIVNSEQNYEKFSQQSPNCFLFENAVDSFFINNEPTKIIKNTKPKIGYVGWIPHKDNDYSRSMSPLKLYQYLASGVPIVSTNVAGISEYKTCVQIANNYDEFVSAIDYVIKNDTIDNSLERINIARKQTWDIRTQEILSAVLYKLDSENK